MKSRGLLLMLMSLNLGLGIMLVSAIGLIISDYGPASCHLILWPSTLFIPLFYLVSHSSPSPAAAAAAAAAAADIDLDLDLLWCLLFLRKFEFL